jgi:hypothetical protein
MRRADGGSPSAHLHIFKVLDRQRGGRGLERAGLGLLLAEDQSLAVKRLDYKDSHDGDKLKELLEGKCHMTEAKHAPAGQKDRLTLPSVHNLRQPLAYCPPAVGPEPAKSWGEPSGN